MSEPAALPRELGDGLVLRRATAADREVLARFNGATHAAPYDAVAERWTRELLGGGHPTGAGEHVLLVEERASGAIVSSACLIPQTWTYAGIPIPVGRPELVGTAPAWRRRGLVRQQFRVLHAWGAARGELLEVITGIPNYYRQFGYEPAIGAAGARAPLALLPPRGPGPEPYRLRPAAEADLPLLARLGRQVEARALVAVRRDAALWRYELFGRRRDSDYGQVARIVETAAGQPVGAVVHWAAVGPGELGCVFAELLPGVAWHAVGPSVLRALAAIGRDLAAAAGDGGCLAALRVTLPPEHPLRRSFPALLGEPTPPFYLYVRVGDLPAFVRRVAPALEARLAASPFAGYDGELALSFYRDGLRLRFAAGRLIAAEPWQPATDAPGDAAFPGLTFLSLLLGDRTLADLAAAHPDCRPGRDPARGLLQTLFPPQGSEIWPIG